VLHEKSLRIIRHNGLTEGHFVVYKKEYQFIMAHYEKYDMVPDLVTFLEHFRDFDVFLVTESDKYLIDTIQEEFSYKYMVPFIHDAAALLKVDARQAVDFIVTNMDKLQKLTAQYRAGVDIVQDSDARREEFRDRNSMKGLLGIHTGIKELDEITHGWLKEDFIVILGRTNEGKSWVLLFFLVAAWAAGKNVLLYSGEMGHTVVGFRFDTVHAHFSNRALMGGKDELQGEAAEEKKTPDDYYTYLTNLSKTETKFVVVTPKDLNGKRLTVPMLQALIEQVGADIVGIDQISLMEDARKEKGQQGRMDYTHISEDLYITSEKYGIPILAPAQANRNGSKKKKKDDESGSEEQTPELEDTAESDGIPQNATRVLAIRQLGATMKITLRKNRYGERNKDMLLIWDIDKGIVKPFLLASTDDKGVAVATTSLSGEELF
jgi:replicative DNA helicase